MERRTWAKLLLVLCAAASFTGVRSSLFGPSCHYSCTQCKGPGYAQCEICSMGRTLTPVGSYLSGPMTLQDFGLCECPGDVAVNLIQKGCTDSGSLPKLVS